LADLGLQPHLLSDSLVDSLISIALRYRDRIDPALFAPQVNWRSAQNERRIGIDATKLPLLAKGTV
jgi:UDP-sulfoquinovose synthase